MIASMCQPGTNGVWGSMIRHAWRTNSRKCRAASSRSTFARSCGLANQDCKLLEFFIGKLPQFRRRSDGDRSTARPAVFVAEVILVAKKILGEENVRSRVPLVGQCPQVPAKRYPAASLAAIDRFGEVRLLFPAFQCSHA